MAATADDEMGVRLVDALSSMYGSHPGHRAAHAKGVLAAATFTPAPDAAGLSRAPHLAGGPHRAHVRFSNGSGDPTVADGVRDGRGIAVKVYLPDGSTTDMVGLTLPVFFTRTPEDLIAFNVARRVDPATGAPDLEKVGAYLGEHPEAMAGVTAAMSALPPASFAQLTFHLIHAFGFVADGATRWGRVHLVPAAGEASISEEEAAAAAHDYLSEELTARLAAGPVVFDVELELAPDDAELDDPTAVWPDDLERVPLGRLEITGIATDREHDGDILVFDPTRVPDGIELPADRILHARSAAYRESVRRRTS